MTDYYQWRQDRPAVTIISVINMRHYFYGRKVERVIASLFTLFWICHYVGWDADILGVEPLQQSACN